jgi:hypothetical protein
MRSPLAHLDKATVYTHLLLNVILPPQPPKFGGSSDFLSI